MSCSRTGPPAQCEERARAEVEMRVLGVVVVLALAAPAWSDEIYRWTDESGHVHYSNSSAPDTGSTRVPDSPPGAKRHAQAPEESDDDAPVDGGTVSTGVSLRRNAPEPDL